MANLAQKYRPKTFDEITEQRVVVDIVSNICNSADVLSNRNFLFIGPAGTGKAQPLDSSVLTPHGIKLMGDIKIGDQVVTGHGNIGNVTGIYPQGRRNIYRITLSDDSSIRVSDEHLNVFYTEDETTSERTDHCETTMQLISRFELNPEPLNIDCLHLTHDRDTGEYSVEVDRWYKRCITSITYEGIEECQCIMIDHPDHTYISDGLIPTHNTTTARAIGTALNGNSENIIEVDAASHSGVDSMREIIEQAKSYPVGSKYKIFILDEVHAFSPAAWQSALKTLEEQPARSIFLLCTTNPEKIPATILSRVQTFQLTKISLNGIYNRLIYIINHENAEGKNITYEEEAVRYIAKLAQGGMRDAITNLEQVLAYTSNITSQAVQEALSLPAYDDYFKLLNAYAKKQNDVLVSIIDSVYNSGVNFIKWFDGFFSFVTNIVKYIYTKDINSTMIPSTYQDKIQGYSTAHAALCLKLSRMLVKMIQELKGTQYLQEVAISYLCTPQTAQKGQ